MMILVKRESRKTDHGEAWVAELVDARDLKSIEANPNSSIKINK